MIEYFYIPKEHDVSILPAIKAWTSEPNNGWIIITGVYEQEGYTEGYSVIFNVNIIRQKEYIKLGQISKDFGIEKSLTAFCLEGDLDYYNPEFKAQLLSLSGVLVFNSNTDYLEYVDLLN